MTFSEKLQREKLASLKGQLQYANDCLLNRKSEMASYEVKEYEGMKSDFEQEIEQLETHIKNVF